MKLFSICHIFFLIFCGSSALVRSQDSCSINTVQGLSLDTSSFLCVPVWEAQGFILRYAQTSPDVWSFVLSFSTDIKSYAALGFSKDGNMVGSSAVVAWNDGVTGVEQYYLGGRSPDKVILNEGELPLINRSLLTTPRTSRAYMHFHLQTSQPSPHLIFAVGPHGSFPSGPSFFLSKHSDKISLEIDYGKGTARKTSNLKLKRSHGVLNMAGWTLLMIVGAIIARHCKQWDPIWFYLHSSIQTIGFAAGVVGLLSGLALSKKVSANVTHHKNIGILILVLGFLQVMALVLRPGKESKIRKYWNYYHHNVGRILIIFAVANTFFGLHLGGEGSKWFAGYGITLAILVIIAIVLEIRMWTISRNQLPN